MAVWSVCVVLHVYYVVCFAGTRAKWTQPPPARVKADESFTVVYEFFLEEPFWNWAVLEQLPFKHNFFRDANYTGIRYENMILK